MILLNVSIFFWDFYAGQFTRGFGVLEPYHGIGMFYVYTISYLSSFLVVGAIQWSESKWMGLLVWLPYAVVGLFVEAYFELYLNPVLRGWWGVVGWCAFGLFTGLSADMCDHAVERRTHLKAPARGALTGVGMSLVYFLTTLIAVSFFYETGGAGSVADPGTFLGVTYFGLPWMLVHAFMGGMTAGALHELHARRRPGGTLNGGTNV